MFRKMVGRNYSFFAAFFCANAFMYAVTAAVTAMVFPFSNFSESAS